MVFYDFLFVFFVALFLTIAFAMGFRKQRDRSVIIVFFVLLFLMTWGIGLWIVPVSPPWGTVPWLSFLIVGIIVALLLAALTPISRSSKEKEPGESLEELKNERNAIVRFDIFFLAVILVVIGIIIAFYIQNY